MCNDSVFYASRGLDKFLKDMKDPEPDVLGATENYEIQTHLGSFFVSLAGDILRNPRFQSYWKRYRQSDVRTSVIVRGEMGLSKVLNQCGATPAQMAALYDSTYYYNALDETDVLNASIQLARTSTVTGWKRLQWGKILQSALRQTSFEENQLTSIADRRQLSRRPVWTEISNADDFLKAVAEISGKDTLSNREHALTLLKAHLVDIFRSGSQIHQNAGILLYLGLPIVKMDGVYRGMFSVQDTYKICGLLDTEEARRLSHELLRRRYGGETLIGWKLAAFMRGLI